MRVLLKAKQIVMVAVCAISLGQAHSAEKPPKVLANYLPVNQVVKGNIVIVLPPPEIKEYIAKVRDSAKKDPEWFKEYSTKAKPGVPLPYDEKLGLSKEDYQKYRALWDKREFKTLEPVEMRLESIGSKWMIRFAAKGLGLTLLRYDAKKDVFSGVAGKLERIEEIDAPADSIMRAWKGHEWKFTKEGALGLTKENFAIGKSSDGKHGMIVYRMQNISGEGVPLADENLLIRFALKKGK